MDCVPDQERLVTDRESASLFTSAGGKAFGPTTEHLSEAAATANLRELSNPLPFNLLLIKAVENVAPAPQVSTTSRVGAPM